MNTMDPKMQTSRLPDPSAATLPITHRPAHRQLRHTAFGHSTSLLGLTLGVFLLAGCAASSDEYDGVYKVTATPAALSSSETGCAPFTEDLVVQDGRIESATRGGVVGKSPEKSCHWNHWHYRAQYEGTANESPTAD